MTKERFRAWLENIVIIFHPCLFRQCIGVEEFVTCLFCRLDVLLNRLHFRISRTEERAHRFWNFFFSEPAKLTDYCETLRFDRFCPGGQRIGETDVISSPFRPEQINFWKDAWNVFH